MVESRAPAYCYLYYLCNLISAFILDSAVGEHKFLLIQQHHHSHIRMSVYVTLSSSTFASF